MGRRPGTPGKLRSMRTAARLVGLAAAGLAPGALAHDTPTLENPALSSSGPNHLAVMVPAYSGDLSRAVSSLERWPSKCSPVTQENVDLVLYYGHTEGTSVEVAEAAVAEIAATAGRCFARTRTVYATLKEEDNVYPKGPSVQFYDMFLDENVRSQLEEYDALAIIEWDVLVASDKSFEQLYAAAFDGSEEFWMKGSNVGGTTFHDTAKLEDMWRVLGHINGNAIYNNNDPAFVEYIDYTRARWQYDYPYDLALWLTISDFPYSWPLWQRYSNKFVTTNLISYVGLDRVDHDKVSDAVAGNTLFLHGRRIDDGNMASVKATSKTSRRRERRQRKRRRLASEPLDVDEQEERSMCSSACDGGDDTGLPSGVSTFCDDTCAGDGARFDGFLCGASNTERFGQMCRLCYTDVDEARKMEKMLSDNGEDESRHVVMCDSKRPPEASDCDEHCALKTDTVCDESCGSGRHGDYNCNWRDHGAKCRFCFDDLESALVADKVAMRHQGRVIMCDTMEPPRIGVVEVAEPEKPSLRATGKAKTEVQRKRKLQKWKENQNWQTEEKWKSGTSTAEEPKWKTNEKWRGNQGETSTSDVIPKWKEKKKWQGNEEDGIQPKWASNFCLAGCDYTSSDGTKGRVCDDTCLDGIPNGTNGCRAKSGLYGNFCRVCYNDAEKAAKQSTDPENPAIMCDEVYTRRLTQTPVEERAPRVANKLEQWKEKNSAASGSAARRKKARSRTLQAWKESEKWKTTEKWKDDPATSTEDSFVPKWKEQEKWRGNQGETTTSDVTPKWKDKQKWKGDEEEGIEPKWKDKNTCKAGCEYTSNDGSRGRACDPSCVEGMNGCVAKSGLYGNKCRVCYNDDNKFKKQDTDPTNPPVTCASLLIYNSRRLEAVPKDSAPSLANKLETLKEANVSETRSRSHEGESLPSDAVIGGVKAGDVEDTATFFAELAERQFTPELIRGNLCAFIPGGAQEVEEWEVTVRSMLQFLPGMRVAVAADSAGFKDYQSAVGNYPGVTVSLTGDVPTASLYADEYCGAGTSLIYYAQVRSLFSRAITSKDTHSTRGDLLVVYSDPLSVEDSNLVHLTTEVLGFNSASFVQGADLFLPVEANAELREVLSSEVGDDRRGGSEVSAVGFARLREFNNPAAVPQVMASLQYSKNTPGIWFVSPQQWVKQHLFKEASIWNIPLVKPRYTCSADATVLAAKELQDVEVSTLLQRSLDFFSNGGTCENGRIAVEPAL